MILLKKDANQISIYPLKCDTLLIDRVKSFVTNFNLTVIQFGNRNVSRDGSNNLPIFNVV